MITTPPPLDPADEEEFLVYANVQLDLQVRIELHPRHVGDEELVKELVKQEIESGNFHCVDSLLIQDVDVHPVR